MVDYGAGCPDYMTNTVTIAYVVPPVVQFDSPSAACAGQLIQFTDESVVDPDATAQYYWEFLGDQYRIKNPIHSFTTEGSQSITLTVSYEGLSCENTLSKTIDVRAGLNPEIVASTEVLCAGEASTLSLSDSYLKYSWSNGEAGSSILVDQAGTYSVSVTDNTGCEGQAEIIMDAYPDPEVLITADKVSVAPGEQIQLTATGLETYSWSPEESLSDPTISNPIATIKETTEYTVTGEDSNGCSGQSSIIIYSQTDLIGNIIKPKNFFSPNTSDDINSVWLIEKIEQFPQCGVTVVDQTGNIMLDAKPYLNDWNGTNQGRDLPVGVYYYVIKCDDEQIVKSGSVTLLR